MAVAAGTVVGYSKPAKDNKDKKGDAKGNNGGQTPNRNGGGGQSDNTPGPGNGNARKNGGDSDNSTPNQNRNGKSTGDSQPKPDAIDKSVSARQIAVLADPMLLRM